MNKTTKFAIVFNLLLLICCILTTGCFEQPPHAQNSLKQLTDAIPAAEYVLASFVDATGGQAAYDKIKNRVVKRTMTVSGQNIEVEMTFYKAKLDKAYMIMESAQFGKLEEGTNGKVAWSISLQTGPVVFEGKLNESKRNKMAFDNLIYWQKYYKNPRCTGTEEVNGKDCYVVQLTPKVSDEKNKLNPEYYYFDRETHLLLRTVGTVITEKGEFKVDIIYSDYREVDGFKRPYKSVMTFPGQQRIFTTKSTEHNVEIPKERFDLPEEIKNLVNKKKS